MYYLEDYLSSYLILIVTLQVSPSAWPAGTTSASPQGDVEDKKPTTGTIDSHRPIGKGVVYNQVESFSWDDGLYNSEFATVYVPLEGTILLSSPKYLAGFIARSLQGRDCGGRGTVVGE